jgi:hypothetical protein
MRDFFTLPSMITSGSKSSMLSLLRFSGAMVLVLIYLVSGARLNTLHRLFHDDQHAVEHFAENEKDPCHRTIYHKDTSGCDHRSHVSEVTKCNYCDITSVPDHISLPELAVDEQHIIATPFDPLVDHCSTSSRLNLSARAPPTA